MQFGKPNRNTTSKANNEKLKPIIMNLLQNCRSINSCINCLCHRKARAVDCNATAGHHHQRLPTRTPVSSFSPVSTSTRFSFPSPAPAARHQVTTPPRPDSATCSSPSCPVSGRPVGPAVVRRMVPRMGTRLQQQRRQRTRPQLNQPNRDIDSAEATVNHIAAMESCDTCGR